jgi:hypothetical protein
MPTLHAEGDIIQDLHCGITSTAWIGKREMIDLENRIVLVVVGSGNAVGADFSLLVQNTHPAKLSQASSTRPQPLEPIKRKGFNALADRIGSVSTAADDGFPGDRPSRCPRVAVGLDQTIDDSINEIRFGCNIH